MPNTKEMSTYTLAGQVYEIKDASARSDINTINTNINNINTTLESKADTSNYYTKSETYTKTEVNSLIESSGGGSGGGTGDGDVKRALLFDSILDDPTKTSVNITINTAGEAAENEVQNLRNTIIMIWGTGTAENPGVGRVATRSSGYLGFSGNGYCLCLPVIGGHTYKFVPETPRQEDGYQTMQQSCFAPDFDFNFHEAYKDIPNTYGSIACDNSIHMTDGRGYIFNTGMVTVPEGMQYLFWSCWPAFLDENNNLRVFKVYDYTLYPVDATYEQIVDNPVTGEDFTITYNLTNSTSTNTASTVATGTTYTTTINANQNNYISSCSIVVGGTTYTSTNGSLVINEANSNITINATGESAPNNTYEGFYTVKESLIPDSILENKLDTPNGLLNATEGKLLYTDGEGGLTLSLPKESVDIITHDLEYVPVYGEWIAGYYYEIDGTYTQATTETVWGQSFVGRVNCTPYDSMIECKQGEKWRFNIPYLYRDSDKAYLPSVLIFDENKNLLDTIIHATAEEDGYIYKTIPENGAYLVVIHLTGGTCLMQRLGLPVYTKRQVEDLIESNWNVTKRLPAPKLNTLTKGYICVGTDDLRVQHTENLHNMYTEHNIPYYMAAIPEMLKHTAGGTSYRNNLYYARQCVANGGELCVHNGGQITADNIDDYDKLYDYFIEKRRELEFYGFKVRGIITAGGTGVIKSDERINKWCSTFYDFNDTMGYTLPYLFGRRDFAFTTEADLDTYVENVCVNHGYQIFYAHNYADAEINSFNYLLEKLSNYTRGVDYEFITPSQLYDLLMPKKQDDYYNKSEVDSLIANIDGGGLSNTAKSLLLTILKATVTNSNQASNIAALETELNGSVTPTPSVNYTITNTLTNCSNSNNASTIQENSSYTATITANSGYTLDSVTITMGGTDITSTVYNNGAISINNVTGNIVITASATINESEETEIELTTSNQYILQNGTCNVSYSDGTEDAQFTNFKYVTSVEPFIEDTEVTATITHASTDQYLRYQKPNHFGSTPTAPTTTRADTRVVTNCIINDDMSDVVTVTWTVKAGNYLIMFYPQYLNAWDCTITAVRR